MADKILASEDIKDIRSWAANMRKYIENYIVDIDKVIAGFENEEIVQKFYNVGNFGQVEKEKLINIKNALKKFEDVLCKDGGLVSETEKYLSIAQRLNVVGKE